MPPLFASPTTAMEVWASVASWFFRPECSSMSTAASCQNSAKVVSSSSSQPSSASSSCQSRVIQAPTICTAIRCTVPGCSCECFTPGKRHLRYCETCKHGWVPHALDKLGSRHLFTNSVPEPVQPNAAFDIASLVLYGCQALPIRLKILLDRLFSVLQKDQVIQVLHGFGWTQEDYARGYILQEVHGTALDKWSICSPEEEPLVLQQFLRFGETRAITQQLLLAQQVLQEPQMLDHLERKSLSQPPRRTVSPNHRPSPPTFTPSAFNPSRLPSMSPHQKHSLNFLKLPSINGPPSVSTIPSIAPIASVQPPPPSTSCSPPNVVPSATMSLSSSPLNRLQNMQPFDFRKLSVAFPQVSPDLQSRRRIPDTDTIPSGLNLSMSSAIPLCLPPPPPPPPVSAAISIANSLSHSAAAMAAAAAVTANPLAAASLVASSFPSLISSGSKSPSTADLLSAGGSSDFGSEDDDDDEENSHSALNLSRDKDAHKTTARSHHHQQQQQQHQLQPRPGHVRKATTPTKRHWGSSSLPLNLGTQFINPATGKKRVQCNVCLKTFCDKGALKIHFSAVHLREMHKCTVEGCNMMFSSRRSRNRHSANPNPKLHSPHLRRKISPHDGRSAQAHPLLIPPQSGLSLPAAAAALSPLNPFGPFPLLTPPRDIRHHSALAAMDFKQSLDLSMQRFEDARKDFHTSSSEDGALALTTSSHHDDDDDDDDDGIVVVGGDGDDDDDTERNESTEGNEISDQPEDFSMPSKRPKMSVSDVEEDMASNVDSNEDSLSVVDTHSLKDDSNYTTNKRKRKSLNPTRCAIPQIMEDGMTDCDSSNDIVFSEPILALTTREDIREPEDLIKRVNNYCPARLYEHNEDPSKNDQKLNQVARCSSVTDLTKPSPDVNANDSEINAEIKTSLAPLFPLEKYKKEKNNLELLNETEIHDREENNEQTVDNDEDREKERPASSADSHKSEESRDSLHTSNALRQLETLSHGHFSQALGLSQAQYPSLGFALSGDTTIDPPSPARSHTSSAASSNGAESPDENSQNQIFGHFENGQFISTMDVPIDKDNPRRCTACGKIFQNHFGVKTHYQNVHLKLMHKCNVDGCNAAFPSKRSRDRHSANLNLHRKLLSTSSSSEKSCVVASVGTGAGTSSATGTNSLFMDKSPYTALHNEFLARLYADTHGLPLPPPPGALEQMMMNGAAAAAAAAQVAAAAAAAQVAAAATTTTTTSSSTSSSSSTTTSSAERLAPPPLLLPPLAFPGLSALPGLPELPGFPHSNGRKERLSEGSGSGQTSPVSSPIPLTPVYSVEDEMPEADADGRLPCRVCRNSFSNINALRDHCEQKHAVDMHHCPVTGCPRLFLSRTRRNQHVEIHTSSLQPPPSTTNGNCS